MSMSRCKPGCYAQVCTRHISLSLALTMPNVPDRQLEIGASTRRLHLQSSGWGRKEGTATAAVSRCGQEGPQAAPQFQTARARAKHPPPAAAAAAAAAAPPGHSSGGERHHIARERVAIVKKRKEKARSGGRASLYMARSMGDREGVLEITASECVCVW